MNNASQARVVVARGRGREWQIEVTGSVTAMLDDLEVLRVLEPGERTVVSLGDVEFPDEVVLERCRADLDRLLADGHVRTLAFDLDGVVIIPSTMLGLLLTVRGRGVQVELINPSPDVREVLRITRLESRFRVLPDGR